MTTEKRHSPSTFARPAHTAAAVATPDANQAALLARACAACASRIHCAHVYCDSEIWVAYGTY